MELSVQEYVAMQPKFTWRRRLMRGMIRLILPLLMKLEIRGVENVPPDGAAVLMMNHISIIDPVLCMAAVTNRFVIPMSKIENEKSPIWGPFVRFWGAYTIDRDSVDRKALMNSIELLKSGQLILIAPEGTRQKHGLTTPKEGFAYIVTKADAVIVPAAISGAMPWLNDLKRLKRTHIIVNFGKPFKFKTEGRVPREQLSIMMNEAMYQLSAAVTDESQRGVYSDLTKATTNYIEFV